MDQIPNETPVEPGEKRHLLSDEAFELRNRLIGEAKAKGRKDYSREMAFSAWGELHQRYDGREEPVAAEEYLRDHDAFIAELPSEVGDPQFTKRAHYRLRRCSYGTQEALREAFRGKSNVDLLALELAIVDLEKKDPHGRKGLDADSDSTETCDSKIARNCWGELLTLVWDEERGPRGEYSPDLRDDDLAVVCPACDLETVELIRKHNRKVVDACAKCQDLKSRGEKGRHNDHVGAGQEVTYLYPRMLPFDEARAAFEKKQAAINAQKERDDRVGSFLVSLGERSKVLREMAPARRKDRR